MLRARTSPPSRPCWEHKPQRMTRFAGQSSPRNRLEVAPPNRPVTTCRLRKVTSCACNPSTKYPANASQGRRSGASPIGRKASPVHQRRQERGADVPLADLLQPLDKLGVGLAKHPPHLYGPGYAALPSIGLEAKPPALCQATAVSNQNTTAPPQAPHPVLLQKGCPSVYQPFPLHSSAARRAPPCWIQAAAGENPRRIQAVSHQTAC